MGIDSDLDCELSVVADPAELSSLRQHVAEAAAAAGAPDAVVEDFRLVVSELATNVIRHTDSATLTVVFRSAQNGWVLDVSNADDLADIETHPAPDPTHLGGHGLTIVRAAMDDVHLVDVGGQRYIRCCKHAP